MKVKELIEMLKNCPLENDIELGIKYGIDDTEEGFYYIEAEGREEVTVENYRQFSKDNTTFIYAHENTLEEEKQILRKWGR